MKTCSLRSVSNASVLALVLLFSCGRVWAGEAPLLFEEQFGKYKVGAKGEAKLKDKWNFVSGRTPVIVSLPEFSQPVMSLVDGVICVELKKPLKKVAIAEVSLLHSKYQRSQRLGFFNEVLSKGYVVNWDSSIDGNFGSCGVLTLRKVDLEKALESNASNAGLLTFLLDPASFQQIGLPVACPRQDGVDGQRAITGRPAKIRFEWREGGKLTVSVDGAKILEESDPEITEFFAFVLSGNDAGIFEEVKLFGE